MAVLIKYVETGADSNLDTHYYIHGTVDDVAITPFYGSLVELVDSAGEKALRETPAEFWARSRGYEDAPTEASLTNEGTAQFVDTLSTLLDGDEVSIDQKACLYRLDGYIDSIYGERLHNYDELEDEALSKLVESTGLISEMANFEASNDGEPLETWIRDDVNDGVYCHDGWVATLPGPSPYPERDMPVSPEHRKLSAAFFIVRTRLATGALYAAGMSGDTRALTVGEQLNKIAALEFEA